MEKWVNRIWELPVEDIGPPGPEPSYADMAAMFKAPGIVRLPPSAELCLRRDLAERAIWEAAKAEVMARPYEKPGWDRDVSPEEWQRWMMADSYVDAERAESIWAWINDTEAQERLHESQEWHRRADMAADPPARDREIERLVDSRRPNWETDEPPPLTAEQKAIFDRHITSGQCFPVSRAREELLGDPVPMNMWSAGPPRCYANRNGITNPDDLSWCGFCDPGSAPVTPGR
jgi:hypothetical protein